MDPATTQQLLQAIKSLRGEIPISTIIMVLILGVFIGERIWDKVLKARTLAESKKKLEEKPSPAPVQQYLTNSSKTVAITLLEEQALIKHHQTTENMAAGVEQLCKSAAEQAKSSVKMLMVMGQIAKNTKSANRRRG